jgi:hypothetical protein
MATDNRLIAAHLTAALLTKDTYKATNADVAAKLYFDVLKSLEVEAEKHKAAAPTASASTYQVKRIAP